MEYAFADGGKATAVDDSLHCLSAAGTGGPRENGRGWRYDLQGTQPAIAAAEGQGEATQGAPIVYQDIDRTEAIQILQALQQRLDDEFNRVCADYSAGRWSRDEGWQLRSTRFRELRALHHALNCLTKVEKTDR